MKNQLPTRREIRNYHDSLLTDVYCDFGSPEIKKFLGIVPPLSGPDTHDINKAFTHDTILRKLLIN